MMFLMRFSKLMSSLHMVLRRVKMTQTPISKGMYNLMVTTKSWDHSPTHRNIGTHIFLHSLSHTLKNLRVGKQDMRCNSDQMLPRLGVHSTWKIT